MMRPVTLLRAAMILKSSAGRSKVRLTMLATLVLGMVAFASPAWAETFTVTNTNDSGDGSLRRAIENANFAFEADTITLAPEVRGTITLASTLGVRNDLTIEGPGPQALTISGNNAVRPLSVNMGTTLNLSGVTIANGRAVARDPLPSDNPDSQGGAIYNGGGTLNIRESALKSNFALYWGGAVFNQGGKVNVVDSTLSGNRSVEGGAIYNMPVVGFFGQEFACEATVTGSTLSGNSASEGGALYNSGRCEANITGGSRVDGNSASHGGGVFNAAILRITGSTLSGNSASEGGGVYTTHDLIVQRSTFSGNRAGVQGGGLYESAGVMTVDDSAFYGNYGEEGYGGVGIAGGSATITNSTLSANESGDQGAGIGIAGGNVTITNSTVSGNRVLYSRAGGVWVSRTATTAPTIRGSIVAGNTTLSGNPDLEGNYTNGGFNLIGGTAAAAGLQTDASGAPVLANNGGPTQTVALVRDSDAIDAGNTFGATTDQRGTSRPKDYASVENAPGGDGSDIGAFEYVDPDATAPTINASRSPLPNEGGLNNSDVTVAINATDEVGGSGVWRVSYSASGAQQLAEQNVSANSAELVVSSEGETTVTYWATDKAGNRSASGTLTVRVDKTTPETSIGSGPSGSVKSTSASFGFSSPDAGATFECKLDGSAFAPCTSPKSYTSLKNGKHTFSVRTADEAGNVDATPAVRTWTVDTVKPTISGISPRHKSVIRDTTPTITATVKDRLTNLQKRNIKLFVAGKAIPASKFRYSAATDKLTYNSPNLGKGKKTVKIVATDAAKTVGTKSWYFTIK